ncbi:MAG TPA: hypothetical protein VNE59_12515 [Burkholderiales bacterium]|nr:hypothetical protein [Burkholderiales bacterium]
MSKTEIAAKAAKRRPARSECCADQECASGRRNRYFVGKRLTPDAFRVEQDYLVERRRLLNRAIHGWGVVYGYPVAMAKPDKRCPEAAAGRLEIGAGLALDQPGRELVQTATLSLGFGSVTVFDEKGNPLPTTKGCEPARKTPPPANSCWLLSVHYAERPVAPLTLKDACSCERREWDQVCETVHYSVRPVDCAKCCAPQPCELECDCATGPCCGERALRPPVEPAQRPVEAAKGQSAAETIERIREVVPPEKLPVREPRGEDQYFPRGGCRCLCDHLTHLPVGAQCDRLCEIDTECGPARVDLHNGVPLACVALGQDECGHWSFVNVLDTCGPRRLVKGNDLLFDLIRGCDLTRITQIGWARWHRSPTPVPWPEFNPAWGQENLSGECVTRDFWVEFSKPVRTSTLLPDCFVMTALFSEREGGWRQTLRVPIARIEPSAPTTDPADHTRRATVVVDAAWVDDAIRGSATRFGQLAWMEIEVRGDLIVDCNGQTVDANAVGLSKGPSGNGTPGGTFTSSFPIARQPPKERKPLS